MAYTVRDTPEVVARIEADLARVLGTVRAGDPALRSLLLTGGFARGEGAMLAGRPQNDYDFVAVRGLGRPKEPYAAMAARLERELGLHIDLAPVPAWRLRVAARSIFWYETALRGLVVWGEDVRPRIRVRRPEDLERTEGLRLLVNRAAGLLLGTRWDDHARRIQAAKALLAAADARMLAAGAFPPSQTERWALFPALAARAGIDAERMEWFAWAHRFKVDPGHAAPRDSWDAWKAARRELLEAVPVALRHAGLADLESYARRDGVADHVVFAARAHRVPDARRWARNPTGRVRVATIRLLEASPDGRVPDQANACLRPVVRRPADAVGQLEALRKATLQ